MHCDDPIQWHNLYKQAWNLGVPDAVVHPAKMSPALCDRMLSHLTELGLLAPGDPILDPMGGVGTTGIIAALRGHPVTTVELERRFVDLQQASKAMWERRMGRELPWTILEGDARNLPELLAGRVAAGVLSPPYGDEAGAAGHDPNFVRPDHTEYGRKAAYGTTPGNIGNMKVKAVVSPPYAGDVSDSPSDPHPERMQGGKQGYRGQYGSTEGQIGAMKAVTSPPYKDTAFHDPNFTTLHGETGIRKPYGVTPGQLAEEPDYASQMKLVYAAIGQVADTIAVVTKDPTRKGTLYPLGDITARLLEETGWRVVCRHRAILFEEQEQGGLMGESTKKLKGRVSFFKRLSHRRGSPVAAWEDVLFAVADEVRP